MKTILTLFAIIAFYFVPQHNNLNGLHFLEGTWKVEHKETYETWTVNSNGSLEGYSYKIKAGNKQISEYLKINESNGKIIYTAKVPNQNNGQPIDFEWNQNIKDKFSFENLTHDFPKKVQYTKLNDSTLFVAVLGENDKGFSFKVFKQKSK